MSGLFDTSSENVLIHLKNVYDAEELVEPATTKDFLVVRTEGKRQVKRSLRHYSLDALTTDQGRGLVDVIARYTHTFLWLQRYDEGLLTEPLGRPGGTLPSTDQARSGIARLKTDLMALTPER